MSQSLSVHLRGAATFVALCVCENAASLSMLTPKSCPVWPLELDLRLCPTFPLGCSTVLLCLGQGGSLDSELSALKPGGLRKTGQSGIRCYPHKEAKVKGGTAVREERQGRWAPES